MREQMNGQMTQHKNQRMIEKRHLCMRRTQQFGRETKALHGKQR